MIKMLGRQAQQYDKIHDEQQSRFMLLWQAMINPPLLIKCEITHHHTNMEIKYDEYDEEVANHILDNHEKLLEVNNKEFFFKVILLYMIHTVAKQDFDCKLK